MNPGHSGFEFYNVAEEGHLAPMNRRLHPDWEAEGKVQGMPGYVFRSRRMIHGMGHMLFPRYIQREARDFFYLTARTVLPGSPVSNAAAASLPGEGTWQTKDLPQHGFPPAIATTWVRPNAERADLRIRVVRADPRTLAPIDRAGKDDPTVLAWTASGRGDLSLWWSPGAFTVASEAPTPDAVALAGGSGPGPYGAGSRAALGVQDADGMLDWVELPADVNPDASTATALDELLKQLGCSQRLFLSRDARVIVGGTLDASGQPIATASPVVARLVRAQAPGAHAAYVDTPIVPIQVWQPLQAKRVRYFLKPALTHGAMAAPTAPPAAVPVPATSSGARRAQDPLAREPSRR
jgi:hypothetical protein